MTSIKIPSFKHMGVVESSKQDGQKEGVETTTSNKRRMKLSSHIEGGR